MSLEEFFKAEGSFALVATLIFFVWILPRLIDDWLELRRYAPKIRLFGREKCDVTVENNAKVLYYRTDTTFGINYITFELQNSEKIELEIENREVYEDLLKGGYGTLIYQGEKFISFTKNS